MSLRLLTVRMWWRQIARPWLRRRRPGTPAGELVLYCPHARVEERLAAGWERPAHGRHLGHHSAHSELLVRRG